MSLELAPTTQPLQANTFELYWTQREEKLREKEMGVHNIPSEDQLPQRMQRGSLHEEKAYSTRKV